MQIFKKIAEDKLVEDIIKNLGVSPKYADDLTQEIYLILLEYNKEKIIEMYENKQLNFFLTRVIKNQWMSNTSPFFKKYRKYYDVVDGNVQGNVDVEDDEYTEVDE